MGTNTSKAISILIVDESVRFWQSMTRFIEAEHLQTEYTLTYCHDGNSALHTMLDVSADVVFISSKLRNKDAYQLCHEIREHPKKNMISLVLIGIQRRKVDYERAFQVGCVDSVSRDAEPLELKRLLLSLSSSVYSTSTGSRIVLFKDDPTTSYIVKRFLNKRFIRPLIFNNLDDVKRELPRLPLDMFIFQYNDLHSETYHEICELIRSSEVTAKVKLIGIFSDHDQDKMLEYLDMGVQCLMKPFYQEELWSLTQSLDSVSEKQTINSNSTKYKDQLLSVVLKLSTMTAYQENIMGSLQMLNDERYSLYGNMLSMLFSGVDVPNSTSKGIPRSVFKGYREVTTGRLMGRFYYQINGKIERSNAVAMSFNFNDILSQNDRSVYWMNNSMGEKVSTSDQRMMSDFTQLASLGNLGEGVRNFVLYRCLVGKEETYVVAFNYDKLADEYDAVVLKNYVLTVESMVAFFNHLRDLKKASLEMVSRIELLAREKDPETTGNHVIRMSTYSGIVAKKLSTNPKYSQKITESYIEDMARMAALHDIGKVGVPDAILNKPGKLTREEFDIMKTHTTIGGTCLEGNDSLRMAWEIAVYHHERCDGKGYPYGITGDTIPLSARIVALADVYDALTSERPYKKAYSHEQSMAIIEMGVGTQFDADVYEAFLIAEAEIIEVKERLNDVAVSEVDVVDGHKLRQAG